MPGISSGARLVFVKPAFGRLSFLITHVLGVCVLCLGLACRHASSLGFALSPLVSVGLTWIQMHLLEFVFRMPGLSSSARLVFVKPAVGRLVFFIQHVLGVCVLCLGLAYHHASSFGFALSHLVSVGLTFRCIHLKSLSCFFSRMPGLSSVARLVFVKPAFGRLSFLITHMLGVCVICLGLACHHASALGFALSQLASVGLTWIQMHSLEFTSTFLFRMPDLSSGACMKPWGRAPKPPGLLQGAR
jgi:hypothetical protein